MEYSSFSYSERDLCRIPPRPAESHKGTFGRVLCVAGSRGMCGAAYLAAKAAYRVGAGLVRILTVKENLPILQTLLPEAIVTTYDGEAPEADVIAEAEAWADVLVIGCGMGISRASRSVLSTLLRLSRKPKVLDADALNLLGRNPSLLKYARGAILTPHPLEASRLCGLGVAEILAEPEEIAYRMAKKYGVICAIKTHHTAVSDGGSFLYRNASGNSGMATGGSGDVLAGIIGGLLAQARSTDLSPFTLACLGVYVHGLCGDVAAKRLTEYAVMASDLIDALPEVLVWAEPI